MTAYVADHRKKKAIFAKREQELIHALKNGYSKDRVEKAGEKVRSAQLAIFKMAFSRDSVLPASSYKPGGEALRWQEMSIQEIIDMYSE